MKNENGKLNQAKSNQATTTKEYLEIIILGKDSIAKEFSDKFMIENLPCAGTPNTIRAITRRLHKNGIIETTRMGARGEKFYKIKDYEKANTLYQQNIGLYIHNRKHKPKIAFTPTGVINDPPRNLDSNFLLRLKLGNDEKIWFYPKTSYKEKICPICKTSNLTKYKHGKVGKGMILLPEVPAHDLDRKCLNCKSIFHYQVSSKDRFRELGDELNEEVNESIIIVNDKIPVSVKKQTDVGELEHRYEEARKFYSETNPEIAKIFGKVLQDKP